MVLIYHCGLKPSNALLEGPVVVGGAVDAEEDGEQDEREDEADPVGKLNAVHRHAAQGESRAELRGEAQALRGEAEVGGVYCGHERGGNGGHEAADGGDVPV